jgi:hypothetical protein
MEDDFRPDTQPAGELVPPPRKPPTAVASAAPDPAPGERPIAVRAWRRTGRPLSALGGFVNGVFDVLDSLGDSIAEGVGLR